MWEDELCHAHCIKYDADLVQQEKLTSLPPCHFLTRGQEIEQECPSNKNDRPPPFYGLFGTRGSCLPLWPAAGASDCRGGFEVGGLKARAIAELRPLGTELCERTRQVTEVFIQNLVGGYSREHGDGGNGLAVRRECFYCVDQSTEVDVVRRMHRHYEASRSFRTTRGWTESKGAVGR